MRPKIHTYHIIYLSVEELIINQSVSDQIRSDARNLMCSSHLVHFDPSKKHILNFDSSYGIGYILQQYKENGRLLLVAFASFTLSSAERNYSMVEKEALAYISEVKKMYQCLFGCQFDLETDHKPLLTLLRENKGINPNSSGCIG